MTIYESIGIESDLLDIEIPKNTILANLQKVILPKSAEHYFSVIDKVVLRASINRLGHDLQIIEVKLNDAKYISEISFIIQTAIKYQIIFIFSFEKRYLFVRRSFKLTESTEHVYSKHLSNSTNWIYEEALIDDILMFNTMEELHDGETEDSSWQEDADLPVYKIFSDISNNVAKLNSCILDSNTICLRQFCDWYSGHSIQGRISIYEIIDKIINGDGVEQLNDIIFFDKNVVSYEIGTLEDAKFLKEIDHLGRRPFKYFENIPLLSYDEIEEYVLDNLHKERNFGVHDSKQFIEETLRTYYNIIGQHPLLNEEEEKLLVERMFEGDVVAFERLVCSNLRLVVSIAKKYINKGLDLDDLIQEGTLGLMNALRRFDPTFHSRVSTYAVHWIKQAIRRAIYDTGSLIRYPVHFHEALDKFKRAYEKLQQEYFKEPTVEMLADELGWSERRVESVAQFIEDKVIYNEPINDQGETIFDLVIDDAPPLIDVTESNLLKEQIREILATLAPREAMVLTLRYGLKDGRPRTLEEVGKIFNCTRERIRQIEAKALRRLKHPNKTKKLRDFLEKDTDVNTAFYATFKTNVLTKAHQGRSYPLRLKDEPEYEKETILIKRVDRYKTSSAKLYPPTRIAPAYYEQKEVRNTYVEPDYTIEECKQKANEYGAKNDLTNKFKWLLKAAQKGDSDAQNDIGVAYALGKGVIADANKAVEWYEKAAQQGNAYALSSLASRYYNGIAPCRKNIFKAKYNWISAVVVLQREDDIKQLNEKFPGWQSSYHPQLNFNDSHWRYQLEPMAKLGVPSAEYWYGKHLLIGKNGCEMNYDEARRWLLLSSAHGYLPSATTLDFWFGIDTEEAKTLAEMFNCGTKYSKQAGQQSEDLAFYWYYRAYYSGYKDAANNLGVCYADGKGVSKNSEEANKLYLVGISQSNAGSYYNYAYNLYFGNGVCQDTNKAKNYMIKAADLGNATAKEFLQKHFAINRVNYKSFDQLWFKSQKNVSMSFSKIEAVPEGLKLTFWCCNYNSTNRAFWIESCVVDGEKQAGWEKLVELDGEKNRFVSYLIENKQKADRIEIKIEVDKDSITKLFSYPTLIIALNNITGEVKPFFSFCGVKDKRGTYFKDIEFTAYDDEDVCVEFCDFAVVDGETYANFWIENNRDETINVYAQDIYIDGKKVSSYELITEIEANKSTFGRIQLSSIIPIVYYNVKAYIEIDDEDLDFIGRGDVFSVHVDFEDGTLTIDFDE